MATSEAHTGNVGGVEYLAIGEIVRYRLTAILPEGTSTNLQVVDLLPQGLILLDNDEVKVSFTADNDITEEADLAGADNGALPPTFILPPATHRHGLRGTAAADHVQPGDPGQQRQ